MANRNVLLGTDEGCGSRFSQDDTMPAYVEGRPGDLVVHNLMADSISVTLLDLSFAIGECRNEEERHALQERELHEFQRFSRALRGLPADPAK